MNEDVAQLRRQLGASTTLWAGADGVTLGDGSWTAFSPTRSVDYNVAFCAAGAGALDDVVEAVLAARRPAVVMVAGAALGEVGRLVARSWVCIGATPLMVRSLRVDDGGADLGRGRRLTGAGELTDARALISDVFEVDAQLAAVALPEPVPGQALWGAFDDDGSLRSCLALVLVEETAVVWSMATAADGRGRGHGRAVLRAALADAARDGVRRALLYSSPAGEPFYRRLGFCEVERWQMWSRPRWVLGRA